MSTVCPLFKKDLKHLLVNFVAMIASLIDKGNTAECLNFITWAEKANFMSAEISQ